jgi:cleavage and polyadenylation specificity factor subunit 3
MQMLLGHVSCVLRAGKVLHRQAVAIDKPFSEIRLALEIMFEGIEGAGHLPVKSAQPPGSSSSSSGPGASKAGPASSADVQEECVEVGEIVRVRYRRANDTLGYDTHVVLEWAGGSKGDVVADAVLAVLLQTAGEPAGAAELELRRATALADGDVGAAVLAELQLAGMLLAAQFGPVDVNETTGQISWNVDGVEVVVDVVGGKVSCESEALRVRVEKVMLRIHEAMKPAALDFED